MGRFGERLALKRARPPGAAWAHPSGEASSPLPHATHGQQLIEIRLQLLRQSCGVATADGRRRSGASEQTLQLMVFLAGPASLIG